MEHSLYMTFLTDLGLKSSLRISGVKPAITKDEVNALMNTIIAKNIFKTDSGNLATKSSAQVTQKQVTKYEVA